MDTKQLNLRVPMDVLAEAKALAEREERKLSTMLLLLIKRGIASTKKESTEKQ